MLYAMRCVHHHYPHISYASHVQAELVYIGAPSHDNLSMRHGLGHKTSRRNTFLDGISDRRNTWETRLRFGKVLSTAWAPDQNQRMEGNLVK